MEMIMTAGMVGSDDAFRMGLVNHVVPQAELLDFCNGIAKKIMRNSLWP
jgi:enoyl-CoA hydratase